MAVDFIRHPMVTINPLQHYYQICPKLVYRLGEQGLERPRRTESPQRLQDKVTLSTYICKQYIKNEEGFLTESMPHLVEMFESILPLLDRVDNVHVTEGAMYSDELGLAGRTDLIAEFDGKLAIIDYKTSRRIKTWSMCHRILCKVRSTLMLTKNEQVFQLIIL